MYFGTRIISTRGEELFFIKNYFNVSYIEVYGVCRLRYKTLRSHTYSFYVQYVIESPFS